jgi:uncharacterized protein (DUF4415 family)
MPAEPKRRPGRPSKGDGAKRTISTRLSPDVIAAKDASGRTYDDLLRGALGL